MCLHQLSEEQEEEEENLTEIVIDVPNREDYNYDKVQDQLSVPIRSNERSKSFIRTASKKVRH
jgi:hypothetical protein